MTQPRPMTKFATQFRTHAAELHGCCVRIRCRFNGLSLTYERCGTCTVTGTGDDTVVRVVRTDRPNSDVIDLPNVAWVEVLREGRYRPVEFA